MLIGLILTKPNVNETSQTLLVWPVTVKINKASKSTTLECCVPQGSVLSSILFPLYTVPISEIIGSFATAKLLLNADYIEIYISRTPCYASNNTKGIQGSLSSFKSWMSLNKLKRHHDETEFFVFGE